MAVNVMEPQAPALKLPKSHAPTAVEIQERYEKAYDFNQNIGLYDTVKVNEDFFIGNQWIGVEANGLPTPTYNILKQVVNFQVSTITSENMVIQASPLASVSGMQVKKLERFTKILNRQFAAIMEYNKIVTKMRELLRNAAVDGDGCMYFYFDPTIENNQLVKGEIVAEIIQNTRVHFGNPNCREVQLQPWIMTSIRRTVDDVRHLAKEYREVGCTEIEDPDSIKPDSEKFDNKYDSYTDDKVTVLRYFYKNRDTGTIWCMDVVDKGVLRKPYDTMCKLYPFIWMSWDFIQDCYHGQAMVTGLLPNQKFINKMFAMVQISLMTTAFPKIVYDRTRIRGWDGSVGTAVGVNGNVSDVAKVLEGATMNPQIAQFIDLSMDKTKSLLGANDVAMGDSRPDNTSAIIALQRAANTPMEMTKQAMFQCVEDMGRIWLDIISVKYGTRMVEMDMLEQQPTQHPLGMQLEDTEFVQPFDFSMLKGLSFAIKQDVGISSYWSEIAAQQTLDNLLMNDRITFRQYLERTPNTNIPMRQKLLDEVIAMEGAALPSGPGMGTGMSKESTDLPVSGGSGNGSLQRALNREGA